MGKDNMADGQLPYPSATTGRLRLRVWSVWTAQTELQCSLRPTRPRQLWLCPPGCLDRDRYRKRPRLLSGSRGSARAFQSGSSKARKPPSPVSQSVLVQTAEVASVFYLGPRFSFSNGRRRQRHRRHHRTHSLTPTEDCMLSPAEKPCLPVPRRRRGPLGLQALSGVGRSPSDLGVPRPGLVMDNLSGTHSSVPPLRGHPLLKLQQLNFIHNFSSSLSPSPSSSRRAHCSSVVPRRHACHRACASLVDATPCRLALRCRPKCNRQRVHTPTDRRVTWGRRGSPESKEGMIPCQCCHIL